MTEAKNEEKYEVQKTASSDYGSQSKGVDQVNGTGWNVMTVSKKIEKKGKKVKRNTKSDEIDDIFSSLCL